jgi:hypothetical protein
MSHSNLISSLENLETLIRSLRKEVGKIQIILISKKETRKKAETLSRIWFHELKNKLPIQIDDTIRKKYDDLFNKLLDLATGPSRKSSYIGILNKVLQRWKQEIRIPCLMSPISGVDKLSRILENATEEERDYLQEAIGCANNHFYRASVVLAWSAAISRVHKVILTKGLDEFNKKSKEMKDINSGRYKIFNKLYSVQNLTELERVFDRDILWIIEFWELIDANEHDRLALCFTMRNNSAHPGDASISEDNLLSFYSDLKTMIFDNKNMILD